MALSLSKKAQGKRYCRKWERNGEENEIGALFTNKKAANYIITCGFFRAVP